MEEHFGLKTIGMAKEQHLHLVYLGNQIKIDIKMVKELEQNLLSSSNNNLIDIQIFKKNKRWLSESLNFIYRLNDFLLHKRQVLFISRTRTIRLSADFQN
jgi:hypothetical protein